LRHLGVLGEAEVLQSFDDREPSVEQSSPLASLGAFLDFSFQEGGEIGERGLLLTDRFGRERAEPLPDRGEVQLAGVRLDERFQRLGFGWCAHRSFSFPAWVGRQVPAASS
jgi:hypothetical protein